MALSGKGRRSKGASAEREVLNLLNEQLGTNLSRNLQQTQRGGEDCAELPHVSLEVKRHATLKLNPWWKQTIDQAMASSKAPVLAYRLDRQKWTFVVPLYMISPDFERLNQDCWHDIQFTAALTLDGFCTVIREYWANQEIRTELAA